ncbi:DUF3389 family protein [Shewanella intestini]|uniref:DUF3389 family protein n=1 Tax=Shewanella intestini TaxID=2017544 RepID=A0ABS5HZ44_9GAMM|nr:MULTISPECIES: DUF3389 family protein [Shewanella]MBR9727065.1 DUF3389 family protein [Shewanella intestini]MRG35867.1 DUF3389 family protein [Shewanella sp. XMDDZSB0408]
MLIPFSQGKLIVTAHEVQCRIQQNQVVLSASVDDISCYHQGLVLVADGGTVRWSIALDNAKQFEQILNETGIAAL